MTAANGHDAIALGAVAQSELLASGALTSRQLTQATLAAIVAEKSRLNATIAVFADAALVAADEADRRRAGGEDAPMLGIPIVVKDDLAIAGTVNPRGSNANTQVASADADLVARLREAGMVIVAQSTSPELAIFGFTESERFGVTRNPRNTSHTPGGTSGGSAALVAAGAVGIATASDGAGSIRIPAACCGLVGFKPTHDLMPSSGGWHGLSTQGCVAARAIDVARYLDTFGSFPDSFAAALDVEPAPLRIGLSYSASAATKALPLDGAVRDAMEQAAELLHAAGHEVVEVKIPYGLDAKQLTVRYLAGIRDNMDECDDPSKVEKRTKGIARLGRPFGAKAVRRAIKAGQTFGEAIHDDLGVDVLLTPVMSGPAVEVERWKGKGALRTVLSMNSFYPYTAQWNHAGTPAVSMPLGETADGLPLAIQLIGRRGDDARLMSLVGQFERSTPASR